MELNDEQFWQALRQALQVAEADEAQEMAAAERLLAETPVDAGSRMSEQRIDEVVQFATAPTADELAAAASQPHDDEDDESEHNAPGRVIPISVPAAASAARPSWRKRVMAALPKPLAAAAAILLAPQFLAVAAVATAVVVGSVVLRNTTQTLGYQDAVNVMLQEDASEQARMSSQATVYADVKESIVIVQGLARETSPLTSSAMSALDELRQLLAQGGGFAPQTFSSSPTQLGDQLLDRSLSDEVRANALRDLAQELNYGVTALKGIEQSPGPAALKLQNRVWLTSLSDLLAQ